MKTVAHQTIVMQYILELASQLDRDPRSCVPGFFKRYVTCMYWNHRVVLFEEFAGKGGWGRILGQGGENSLD